VAEVEEVPTDVVHREADIQMMRGSHRSQSCWQVSDLLCQRAIPSVWVGTHMRLEQVEEA
jgi:hypothetical protein